MTRHDQETAAVFAMFVQMAVQIASIDVSKAAAAIDGMRTIEVDIRTHAGVSFKREVHAELRAFVEQVNRQELLAAARALLERWAVPSDELVVSEELPPVSKPPLQGPWL